MKRLFFIAPIALTVFASCLVIKKRYMGGYRVFKQEHVTDLVNKSTCVQKKINPILPQRSPELSLYAFQKNELVMDNTISGKIKSEAEHEIDNILKDNPNKKHVIYFNREKKNDVHIRKSISKNRPSEIEDDPWKITGKSKQIAILLCIILGALGVHRFYLGYTGLGCLYALTFGLFFAGCAIDLIRLFSDDLKPKISESQKKSIRNEIESNTQLAGSPISNNTVAEPEVVTKDAKNGILELNLYYNSIHSGLGFLRFDGYKYFKDENNDPYYRRIPAYDSVKAHRMLMERCQSLGFKTYKKFSGFRKECQERNGGATGICARYKAVIECQCMNQ